MKFIDLFAGIGGFRLGLEKAGHECVGFVEIDKYARKSYEAMHNTEGEWTRNDITEVSDEEWQELRGTVNLVAGGTPCQSFSIAGKRLGFEDTRGTLFFYYANAIKQIQPEYFMFENVKGILSHDKGNTVKTILKTFDEIGYAVDFDIFNSKYYGVPQNRERIFIVGKRKSNTQIYSQRDVTKGTKTIDKIRLWAKENVELISILPSNTGLEVTCRLRDVLEPKVDKKFYLSKEQTDRLVFNMSEREQGGVLPIKEATKQGYSLATDGDSVNLQYPDSKTRRGRVGNQIANTLQAGETNQGVVINPLKGKTSNGWHFEQAVYDDEGITRTLKADGGSGNIPKTIEYAIGASRGRNPENPSDRTTGAPTEQRLEINRDGTTNTLTSVQKDNYVVSQPPFRIRKLTPLETFRLQGFPDELYYKAREVNSYSQLYKQAGNSVTVNVIENIARRLV